MIAVAPGATFEVVTDRFAHLATVALRIRDNAGADFLARTTGGVSEDLNVGTAAVFRRTTTAPATAGQYTLVWDDGTNVATEELVVTYSAPVGLSGSLYVTADELKALLDLTGTTYADDDVTLACESISRAIDLVCDRRFYETDAVTRYFSAGRYDTEIDLGDVISLASVAVDPNGNGDYSETWVDGTDYYLDPPNAVADNVPFRKLVLRSQAGRVFPSYSRSIKVVGSFGYAEIPPQVRQFAKLLAEKMMVRMNSAPLGFQAIVGDVGGFARLARTDPDFEFLIGRLVRTPLFV